MSAGAGWSAALKYRIIIRSLAQVPGLVRPGDVADPLPDISYDRRRVGSHGQYSYRTEGVQVRPDRRDRRAHRRQPTSQRHLDGCGRDVGTRVLRIEVLHAALGQRRHCHRHAIDRGRGEHPVVGRLCLRTATRI
jgi:hypothetical protein